MVEYTYYPDGLVESLTWKNGTTTVATWTYDYDAAGRLTEIEDSFGDITTFAYDEQGKLLTQTNENGTEVNYTYNDSRGWPTNIVHEAASTPFASFALEYDDGTDTVGNLTEVTEIDSGVVSYDYDALYRLTSEAKTGTGSYSKSYGYDVSGNVTTVNSSSFATYDSSNKLSTISGGSVTHDFFGQVKTASGTGLPTSTYTWNVSQRLASQKLGSGSVRNYWYDAFGRLVRTKDTGLATVYIFDGQRVIGEYQDGAPLAVYTWGADGVVARRVLSGGARRWYHYGPQGETRHLTDSSGSVTDTYRYTAYGVPLSSSGSSLNPFRYGGKFGYFYDGFTGILRAGERWYAPHLMRWISRDPILFEGGYNVYEYVGARVTGFVDPEGLMPNWNLVPPQQKNLFDHASRVIEPQSNPKEYSIAAHSDGKRFYGPNNEMYTADQLADMIKSQSDMYRTLKAADYVKLYSCEAGKGYNSPASQLSRALNKRVIAPDELLWPSEDRKGWTIAPRDPNNPNKPHPSKRGTWREVLH
ncbi:MAG: RHS repeat-associated core domain-containing protein [Bdellovibrionota bacterium]|nr:MAG: RHS repeat-associated core domain-containing protein [Bdellovibrionota bacterium]